MAKKTAKFPRFSSVAFIHMETRTWTEWWRRSSSCCPGGWQVSVCHNCYNAIIMQMYKIIQMSCNCWFVISQCFLVILFLTKKGSEWFFSDFLEVWRALCRSPYGPNEKCTPMKLDPGFCACADQAGLGLELSGSFFWGMKMEGRGPTHFLASFLARSEGWSRPTWHHLTI